MSGIAESGPIAGGEASVLPWVALRAAGVVDGWKNSKVGLGSQQSPKSFRESATKWPRPRRRGLCIKKAASPYRWWGAKVVSPPGAVWTEDWGLCLGACSSIPWCLYPWEHTSLVNSLFSFPDDKSGLGRLRLMPSFRSAHKLLSSWEEIQNQQGRKRQHCIVSNTAAQPAEEPNLVHSPWVKETTGLGTILVQRRDCEKTIGLWPREGNMSCFKWWSIQDWNKVLLMETYVLHNTKLSKAPLFAFEEQHQFPEIIRNK